MEEIGQEAEGDTPLQSSVVASLPASAGKNSRGLQSISNEGQCTHPVKKKTLMIEMTKVKT